MEVQHLDNFVNKFIIIFSMILVSRKSKVCTPKSKKDDQNLPGLKSTGLTPTLRRIVLSPISGARTKHPVLSNTSLKSPKKFKMVARSPFSSTPTLEKSQGIRCCYGKLDVMFSYFVFAIEASQATCSSSS